MKLIIDREDLKQQHKNIAAAEVTFHHLKQEVQTVVRIVGMAMFEDDQDHYRQRAIFPDA